jgi:uncharacterized protein
MPIIRFATIRRFAVAACTGLSCLSALATVYPAATHQGTRAFQVSAGQPLQPRKNYLTGSDMPRDPVRAAQLLEQAAEAGEPEAQTRLGMMYQTGTGVSQDFGRAMHWYQLAAASGGLAAKVNMGVLYARGNGVAPDAEMAMQLFRHAFQMGYGTAAAYLGEMYFAGTAVQQDRAAAEEWFRKGMKKHDPVSAYDLGVLYTGEKGHRQDLPKAAEMFRKAAKLEYVPAEYSLGLLIARHPELSPSRDEARKWLGSASDAGFWKANVVLGILSRDGDGIERDQEEALFYFKLAVAQGGESAQKLVGNDLKVLVAKVTAEKAETISARADAWAKSHPPLFLILNSGTGEMTVGDSLGKSDSSCCGSPQTRGGHVPPA